MAVPKYFEKRDNRRRSLTGLMPGRLKLKQSESFLDCKAVDISAGGLGIISSEQMGVGAEVTLCTHDQEIDFSVAWRKPDFGKRDLFRYGLESRNPEFDLTELFIQTGCLK